MPNITTNHAITYTNYNNSVSITSYIPWGSDAIVFGSKIFLAHSSVFQISHDKKSSVFDIEKQQLNNKTNILKWIKPPVVFLNGLFYIFEVDNIIIYNLLLSLLQKTNKQTNKKQQKGSFKP